MKKIAYLVFSILLLSAGHFLALKLGMYEGNVWIDIPLHFFGGVILGTAWLWFMQRQNMQQFFGSPSGLFVGLSVAAFALFGSFVWELFELAFSTWAEEYAHAVKWYSLSASDALTDMLAGLTGGAVVAVACKENLFIIAEE